MQAGAFALALAGLLMAPHLLPQNRLAATSGIALWSAVLVLRAALALALGIIVVLFVPATQLFGLLTHWCLHAVIPLIASHLGFDGHSLGDAATLVPALVMAVSLLSVGFGAWRATRAARRWLRGSALGPGPSESVIVGGEEVVLAAAGLRTPRVVVSAGALVRLDDAELAAGLEHEWGHVRRRHRFIALIAEFCQALSRLLPGGKRALTALQFHLERDADDYAVRRTGDPLALASAICKAAQAAGQAGTPGFARLGGAGVPQRLRRLVKGPTVATSRLATSVARVLAAIMVVLTLGLLAAAPTLASSGVHQLRAATADRGTGCE